MKHKRQDKAQQKHKGKRGDSAHAKHEHASRGEEASHKHGGARKRRDGHAPHGSQDSTLARPEHGHGGDKRRGGGHSGAGLDRPRRSGSGKTWVGKVSAHPSGFGFVDVEGRDKGFFLPAEQMREVLHGDTVEIRTVRKRGRESAEIIRIVAYTSSEIIGQLMQIGNTYTVEPRSSRMNQTILVHAKDVHDARRGDWVRVELQRGSTPMRAKVLEVLGEVNSPQALIELVIAEQALPDAFPPAVLKEAAALSDTVGEKDKEGRLDLRDMPFVTIDGVDAKDFDDAICVLPRGAGGFEAWVAIADVAHYVRSGSALDAEAQQRSNSFYFPDRVIPMLPEKLSNGLCSLNENVDRLAMVVRMRFDVGGRQRSARFYNGLIRSRARLTYAQVASWLEDKKENAIARDDIRDMLMHAAALHIMLEKRREQRGALDLDVPESRAVIEGGTVQDIRETPRNTAHRLIEEMMLAANTAVATHFEAHEHPLLYRVHPAPEKTALESLNLFLKPYGMFVPISKSTGSAHPRDVQDVLSRAVDMPIAHILQKLVLRSMQQAKYTPANEGHFGLAYKRYCHFTSPIRRYADLTTHRSLKTMLAKVRDVATEESLRPVGEHASTQERKQQRAEWDVQAMLAALFHQKDVGNTVPARISGMTSRRMFFELQPTLAEASLSLDSLSGFYDLDEINHRLVTRRGGIVAYTLGDTLDICIDATDPVRGQIQASIPETSASGIITPTKKA